MISRALEAELLIIETMGAANTAFTTAAKTYAVLTFPSLADCQKKPMRVFTYPSDSNP